MKTCEKKTPVAQWVKNLLSMQETEETWIWFLGGEESLEEGMATHSSILAWKIPWTEELQFMVPLKSWTWLNNWATMKKYNKCSTNIAVIYIVLVNKVQHHIKVYFIMIK